MTETVAEEGDYPTTDDGLAASTKRLAEWTFSLQGVGADLKNLVREVKVWAQGQMAHWADSERPPSDPEGDRRRLNDIIDVAARLGAQRATVEINSRHSEGGNGRNGGDKSWKDKVALPLVVAAIIGAIATYAKVSSLETKIEDYVKWDQQRHEENERRTTALEHKVFP